METETKSQSEKLLELIDKRAVELQALRRYIADHSAAFDAEPEANISPFLHLNLCVHGAVNPRKLARDIGGQWRREAICGEISYEGRVDSAGVSLRITIFGAEPLPISAVEFIP